MIPVSRFVDIGDKLRIHYHDEGRGEPVVFLHGSGPGASGWSNFRRNHPYLVERGWRTVLPDTLGFGHSSKPDVDYGFPFVTSALERFLDALGIERCAVVGNSHGGAMAIQLALDRPNMVSKLILMAPGGLEERETYMKMEGIRAMIKAVQTGLTRDSLRRVLSLQLGDPSLLTDEIVDERLAIAKTQPGRLFTTLAVPHLAPRLAELDCPVLAFWGTADLFCPPRGAMRIAEACRRARVVVLSQCGHWVMVEHPDFFNRTVADFLMEA